MKTKYAYISILILFLASGYGVVTAQPGTGKITGTVVTEDNKAATGITVQIKEEENIRVITDDAGRFEFNRLNTGEYTLQINLVGQEALEQTVAVTAGKTSQVNIQLSIKATALNEIVITGYGKSLNPHNSSASLRVQTPLIELAQNVQVVTNRALVDQQVTSMSDGLIKNVSGAVRMEHWGDLYTNIHMRGSQIQAFRNGFNVVASFWGPLTEDMSFVDRIEFVKGPAGFMLANGDPSGLYNVVTKKPTGLNKGEVSFTAGSYDLYRGTVDVDHKLTKDGKLLFRFNGAYQKKGSFRPYEHNDRYVAAPVLSYAFSDKTKLTVEYTWQKASMTEVGSYYIFSTKGYATLPRNFTLTQPGLPRTNINDHSLFANLQHEFNSNWKLTLQAAYLKYNQVGSSSWPSAVNTDGTIIRNVGIWDAASTMKLGQLFVNGNITTGPVKHRILAGVDVGKKEYMADWGQSHDLDTETQPFNTSDPNYGPPSNGMPAFDRTKSLKERATAAGGLIGQEYVSGYIQDELGFFNNSLRLTLAGRYTYVKQYEWGGDGYKANHISPRVGLSYSVTRDASFYAVYDQAFIPQSGVLRSGKSPAPITGNNMEVGFKKDWLGGKWNTTIAAFRIKKQNELATDPNNSAGEQYSIVVGEKEAKGIELDIRGEIIPGLTLIANYAYTDGKVTKVAAGFDHIKVGETVPGFAKHTANTWLGYTLQEGLLKGFGINGGFTFLGGRAIQNFSSDTKDQNLPDYFKLDAGLSWQNRKIGVNVNLFNLLNRYLYNGGYYSAYWAVPAYSWQAEPPRNFRATISYRF